MTASTLRSSKPFWTRHLRRELQYLLDLFVLAGAFVLSYLLRFEFALPDGMVPRFLAQLPVAILIQFLVLLLSGAYRFVWRYVGLAEVQVFARAAVYSALPLLLLRVGLPDRLAAWRIPLSVIVLDTLIGIGGVLALRVLRRVLYERFESERRSRNFGDGRRKRALLAGAGRAGVLAIREIQGRGDLDILPIGFVDDDSSKEGTVIQGIRVLGTTEDLPRLVAELSIDRVIITIAEAGPKAIRRVLDLCERSGARVQIIPGLYEILQGKVSISRFRNVEIEDLLGREPVRLDEKEIRRFVTDKCAVITGAGGSIGSELARQIARFSPRRLLLVERAEGALFEVDRELRELWPQLDVRPLLADVGDPHRIRRVFEEERPQVIFHAAAHKHVPMMEDNPTEAIRNNVLATASLARAAGDLGVEAFVLISTDKAVEPTSLMGASKRLAELVIQDIDRQYKRSRFLAVRFGNVLGSAGSVVTIFRQQIQRGGPLTVTHPSATRYFMTIPEAAQLVLEAGAIGNGGEILILDMGEPVRILSLAMDMIALSGYGEEIPIVFTGLRPGEKLEERLELSNENVDRTLHPKIFVGRLSAYEPERVPGALERLAGAVLAGDGGAIRALVQELIPEADLEGVPSPSPVRSPADPRHDLIH
jgi:FlaA1/EpsC-like NDP-sugar epimerase